MRLLLIILVLLKTASFASITSRKLSVRSIVDRDCGALTKGGVKCVSRTHFVMGFQDPENDKPVQCPAGTVCTSFEQVCSATKEASCTNEVPGAAGLCNMCVPKRLYNPVCISNTEYTFCIRKTLQPSLTYKCKPPKQFCKAIFNKSDPPKLIGICTESPVFLDCPMGNTTVASVD